MIRSNRRTMPDRSALPRALPQVRACRARFVGGMGKASSRRGRETERYKPRLRLREEAMLMKTDPWHSIKADVHHNETNCNTGNNIEPENRREGTGGKPLCAECKRW